MARRLVRSRPLAGNWPVARRAFEESLAGCRELGDLRATASVLSNLADVVSAQGDQALARALLEEAQEKFCQIEDWRGIGWSLNHLGDVARESGDLAGARRLYEEDARLFRDRGDPGGQPDRSPTWVTSRVQRTSWTPPPDYSRMRSLSSRA